MKGHKEDIEMLIPIPIFHFLVAKTRGFLDPVSRKLRFARISLCCDKQLEISKDKWSLASCFHPLKGDHSWYHEYRLRASKKQLSC